MVAYKLANQFIISEEDDELKWYEFIEQEENFLVFEGNAHIDKNNNILFLSDWKETYESKNKIDEPIKWDKTKYYATISDSGNIRIFEVNTGKEVNNQILKELSVKIGCTMKYK